MDLCYNQARMTSLKVAILGSGPAGYTAAIYAARADLQPVLFAGPEPGGQLALTTEVENFPGFPQGIQGPELMQAMRDQAARFGSQIQEVAITKVDFTQRPFRLWAGEQEYQAQAVIISTGASAKWLGLPNEQRLRGHGVSACATCDGFFFKGRTVAVVGGGDAAMEEALFLTKFAQHVTVLVRADKLRASQAMIHKVEQHPTITLRFTTAVVDVLGETSVTGLQLTDTVSGQGERFAVHGLFVAIGHRPNTSIFAGQLELDQKGYLVVHDQVFSNIPGVFVGGDVADYRYRQAVTAAGWGCMAALEAEKFLAQLTAEPSASGA